MSLNLLEIEAVEGRIKELIVNALMLPLDPSSIKSTAPLFGSAQGKEEAGLELDSLAALEIIAAISSEWMNPFDDIEPKDMRNVSSIAEYVHHKLVQ